ncbi:hypothetical protein RHGRI_011081 [Rhododendron griersonianum]|uniref:Transmembrane protein n=1 Tax=Rhododendron griersonianum TaxID=479676 RepID=A0AAV6KKH7_9ERIC|nr:hypothetical protein RHGRI_011081 [Rhododendron griersonianum]
MKLEMSSFSWCAIKSNGVANWVAQAMREKNLSKNGTERERERERESNSGVNVYTRSRISTFSSRTGSSISRTVWGLTSALVLIHSVTLLIDFIFCTFGLKKHKGVNRMQRRWTVGGDF